MDGETGWWTTGGEIGSPLARVKGVGRKQEQQYIRTQEAQYGEFKHNLHLHVNTSLTSRWHGNGEVWLLWK